MIKACKSSSFQKFCAQKIQRHYSVMRQGTSNSQFPTPRQCNLTLICSFTRNQIKQKPLGLETEKQIPGIFKIGLFQDRLNHANEGRGSHRGTSLLYCSYCSPNCPLSTSVSSCALRRKCSAQPASSTRAAGALCMKSAYPTKHSV